MMITISKRIRYLYPLFLAITILLFCSCYFSESHKLFNENNMSVCVVNYLVHFGNEQYEEAWIEAQRIHVEGLFWHPIFRASVLGKLGRAKEAEPYIDELLQIKPEFPKRPREYIKLLFVTEEHVEMIWDGLRKAGVKELQ